MNIFTSLVALKVNCLTNLKSEPLLLAFIVLVLYMVGSLNT